jgi:hypothetical protein
MRSPSNCPRATGNKCARIANVLTTSRRSTWRGRPPDLAAGISSLIRSHCSSVRSDRYGLRMAVASLQGCLVPSPFFF